LAVEIEYNSRPPVAEHVMSHVGIALEHPMNVLIPGEAAHHNEIVPPAVTE
jgi:hypothetical protein